MIDLYEMLHTTIKKYRIDAIWEVGNDILTYKEAEQVIWQDLCKLLNRKRGSISLYGGGGWGRYVYNKLKCNNEINIECIIDNYTKWEDEKIPVWTFEEWENDKETDIVLITNISHAELFKSQLFMNGYKGIIIDIWEWIKKRYTDITILFCEYDTFEKCGFELKGKWNCYDHINDCIRAYEENRKYKDLKKIIFSLFKIKDFYSVECYIEMVKQYNKKNYRDYMDAISDIKKVLNKACSDNLHPSTVVNIIDSLSDDLINDMPFLKKYAEKNIRMKGITVQYPMTSLAIKELFIGKSPFEIELEELKICNENSKILQYACENEMEVYYISALSDIRERVFPYKNDINIINKYYYMSLTEVLFEGLQVICNGKKEQLVFMHSILELHPPYLYVGKLVDYESISWQQYRENYNHCINYVDHVLRWYYVFFDKTNSSFVTMGDHGSTKEWQYELSEAGLKKDMAVCTLERVNPTFIVKTELLSNIEITELIPNNRLADIIMMIMNHNIKEKISEIKQMGSEYVELQQISGYSQYYCEKYIKNGRWGIYEAAVGVRFEKEIYLKFITGKEVYYRRESNCRNLIKDKCYEERINVCRKLLKDKEVPYKLYQKDKYKMHVEYLKKYNMQEWSKIETKIKKQLA